MKKFLTVLLALLLLCGSCLAEGLDYASMTDAQLHDIVDAARNELTKRREKPCCSSRTVFRSI